MIVEWRDSNGQPYLFIEADTYYELGVATGKGLVNQITAAQMMNQFIPVLLKTSLEELTSVAKEYLPFIPEKYQDEIRGIAKGVSEASGQMFSFDDILLQALSLEVLYGRYNFDPRKIDLESLKSFQACTCLGAVNPNGTAVMGQNYDAPGTSGATMSWVLHKVGNEPRVFSARLGGVPGMPVGKNEYGLAMIVNVIISSVTAPVMTPRFVRSREAFATCRTTQEAYKVMYEGDEFPFSLNMMISDSEKIVAVQILPQEIRPNYVMDLMVQANKYDYVDWQKYLLDPDFALERYQRAETLLHDSSRNNTNITNEILLDILRDSPIICRDDEKEMGQTIAFMTRESFGLGNARGKIGVIPI
jgi:acyl-CoA:6-aminopenicillanic acid acyl transferase